MDEARVERHEGVGCRRAGGEEHAAALRVWPAPQHARVSVRKLCMQRKARAPGASHARCVEAERAGVRAGRAGARADRVGDTRRRDVQCDAGRRKHRRLRRGAGEAGVAHAGERAQPVLCAAGPRRRCV
jgi:hypothetical protein